MKKINKAILLLIPTMLLTGCGTKMASMSMMTPIDRTSVNSFNVGVSQDTSKASLAFAIKNSHEMIAGENNTLTTKRMGFEYNLSNLIREPETMDKGLAKLGLLFSAEQYGYMDVDTFKVSLLSVTLDTTNNTMAKVGFKDIEEHKAEEMNYEVDKDDVIGFKLAHSEVTVNGAKNNLVTVAFAGTSTDDEWRSNLDIGADVQGYMRTGDHPDWTNHKHLKGMDIAKNRAKKVIEQYVQEKITNDNPTTYYVTGHSRGAAVATLFGKDLIDANKKAVVYAFNGANIVEKEANMPEYKTIFNFENTDDILSCIPSKEAGFTKYGKIFNIDQVNANEKNETFANDFMYHIEWEYKNLGTSIATTKQTLNEILINRNSLYTINSTAYASDKATVDGLEGVETKKAQILEMAKKYGCENKIEFDNPVAGANNKYTLTWRISNDIVLDILAKFLTKEIEVNAANTMALFALIQELNTFAPTLTSKISSLMVSVMSDMSKIAIPHTPETFLIGVEHIVK